MCVCVCVYIMCVCVCVYICMCIFHYFNYYLPDFVAAICLGFIFGFSLLDICFNLTKCHNKPLVESSFLTRDQDQRSRPEHPMGCSKSSSKRQFYSNTILLQETRKTSIRQPNFIPKTTGKRRTKKFKN